MATKVLPFNLFTGEQKNISAKDEPTHVTAAPDVVLIATKQGKIQVYDRSNDSPLLFEFNTKNSTIYSLQYMNENGYVLTIEKERDQSAINVIRIYTNWRDLPPQYGMLEYQKFSSFNRNHADLVDATSSLTPVKSGMSLKEVQSIVPERYKLLVYTLPLPSSVQTMCVCPVSNYIAACMDKVISIYSAKVSSPIEWVLDIKAEEVKKVVLYDRYLAYYTEKEVFALKLKIEKVNNKQPVDFTDLSQMAKEISQPQARDVNDTMHSVAFKNIEIASRKLTLSRANSQTFSIDDKSSQKYSYYEEDEQYIECVFDDSQIIPWVNINVPSLAQVNAATFASINTPKEILGPIKDVHIVTVNVEDNFRLRSSSVMYYKRLAQNEAIQQICLVPEYADQAGAKNKLSGMRLLVSTTRQGTLFDISNNTHHIITFNYSDDIIDCVASPMFLYSITDTGLEIFAMRATRSSFDDNSMPTTKPCIIGIQPFNGLKTLVVEKDTLVLMCLISEAALLRKMSQKIDVKGITKSPSKKEDVMGWNIYSLKHTTTADIFNQISHKAETSRDNQTVEYQLLLEAHALVSSALSYSQDKQAESEQQPLTTLLKYCNGLLAGYCLRTDNYSNATSLFFQSEVRPIDVCNQFVEKIKAGVSEESSTSSKKKFDDPIMSLHTAFDQYLNSALFSHDGTFEFNEEDAFMANLVLDHYCRFNPFKLGKVILESSLNHYNKEVAINYLEKAEQDKNLAEISLWEMKIALVVLYLACDYRDKALTLLNKIPQNLLVYYCSQNPKLLDAGEHTLGKALRECAPWTLLEILVRVDYKQYEFWTPMRKPVRQNRFSATLGLLANASQLEQQLQELNEQRQLLQKQLEAQKDQSQQLQDLNDQISQLKQIQMKQEEQIQHYKSEVLNDGNKAAQSNVVELVQTPSKSSLFALSPLTKKRLNNELRFKNESRILSMCYLEALLIEKSKQHAQSPSADLERDIEVLFTRLAKVYYEILLLTDVEEIDNLFHQICSVASDQETDATPGKKLSFEYIWKYFHVHCFNAFPRHKWLEQLPPLSENLNQPLQNLQTPDSSANNSPTASMKNIEMSLGFTEQHLKADHFYLRKFQTILSNDIPRNSEEMLALIDSEYQLKDYLLFSLRILCLPRVNQLPEGVNSLIKSTPHVIIDYLKHYCHHKDDWAVVLNALWQAAINLESKMVNEAPSTADEELINQYTIILNHTAKQLSPDEFMALLPVDGDLKFFLPFIETNFRLYKSNKLLNRIQKQALKEQEEQ